MNTQVLRFVRRRFWYQWSAKMNQWIVRDKFLGTKIYVDSIKEEIFKHLDIYQQKRHIMKSRRLKSKRLLKQKP